MTLELVPPHQGEPHGADKASDGGTRSVVKRVFGVLRAFPTDKSSIGLGELAERTGLAKGTLHRICQQLIGEGVIERTRYGYTLTFGLIELGSRVATINKLREYATPILHELAARTGGAAHFGTLEGDESVYLEVVWGHAASTVGARAGVHVPAHSTALGLALLAEVEPERLEQYAAAHDVPLGWLQAESESARTLGYSQCHREGRLMAVAVRVSDHYNSRTYGISLVYPPAPAPRTKESVACLLNAASRLQARLNQPRLPLRMPYPTFETLTGGAL